MIRNIIFSCWDSPRSLNIQYFHYAYATRAQGQCVPTPERYADCTDFWDTMNLPGASQHTKGSNSRKLQTHWRCVFRIEFDIETGPWPPCPPQCRRVASCELVHILTFRRWPRENRTHNIIRRVSQFRNAKRCLYNILLLLFSSDRPFGAIYILIESFYIIKTLIGEKL